MWVKLVSEVLTLGIPAMVRAIKARRARKGKRDLGVEEVDVTKVTDPFLQEVSRRIRERRDGQ